jgi:hypothetical protein
MVFLEIFLFDVKAGDFLNRPRIPLREAFSLTRRYEYGSNQESMLLLSP